MSGARPPRQPIPNIAPHLKQFAEATNFPIDEARVKLAEMAKSRQPPPPPSPSAPTQSIDGPEAVIAQLQRMSHKIDSAEAENNNLQNEVNKLRNVEKKAQFLYEILTAVVNRNFPECQGLNEAWEFYESNGRLPPSLADTLNPSPLHMGSIAGALPAPQSNITPMGQNMMPQQQQQQMVPQQHQMMQQFSNTPIMQQQFSQQQQEQALQFSQLPYGMNPSPMGYAPNQYNMPMPAGQLQPQQQPIQLPYCVNNPQMGYAYNQSNMQMPVGQMQPQPQQPMYGPAAMPFMGQGAMPPNYQ
ncbi:hypothetical protein NU219Hw_g4391t1 [Hortaea werneckii]